MHILTVVADISNGQILIEDDCFTANLKTAQCRLGCGNCALNESFCKMSGYFDDRDFDEGIVHISV